MSRLTRLTHQNARRNAAAAIANVFIANRGEIADRIARTCERLGISAVAPPISGDDAVDLLDPTAVIAAARAAGADAVHPGFGFLAENADFAQSVIDAGLRWIGPPPCCDPRDGRQGGRASARSTSRRTDAGRLRRRRPVRRDACGSGRADRRAAPDQARGRRRWEGDAHGPRPRATAEPRSRPLGARRMPRSATIASSSSGSSKAPGTSRSRSCSTDTATASTSASATARSSVGIRRSSRRRVHRPSMPRSGNGWARPRWPSRQRSATRAQAPASSCSTIAARSRSSR